jgi:hypothetical protein
MHDTISPHFSFKDNKTYTTFRAPLTKALEDIPHGESKGNRPYQMTMEQFLDILIYYHLTHPDSGRHLIQELEQDSFAKTTIAPQDGVKKSSFFEAMHSRDYDFLLKVFNALLARAFSALPKDFSDLGELIAIDGTLIDAVFSATWADYRTNSKKAKAHFGFNVNHSIPSHFTLTAGKADERKEVKHLISKGQTAITDRYYHCHANFDQWQAEGIHFVCRIRENTTKTIITENPLTPGSPVFYDAIVTLGSSKDNSTQTPLRVIGYHVGLKTYWIATDRLDLTAEQIAEIYLLRWKIEVFFGWWKRHLNVYHLLARSWHGLMIQILAGLITYLLLALYCRNSFQENVSIRRVRELRIAIANEHLSSCFVFFIPFFLYYRPPAYLYAKT